MNSQKKSDTMDMMYRIMLVLVSVTLRAGVCLDLGRVFRLRLWLLLLLLLLRVVLREPEELWAGCGR